MILSRITAKAQTTIPRAVRVALGVGPGDTLGYAIEDGRVVLTRVVDDEDGQDPFVNNFELWTEWGDELDARFDRR